MKRYFRILLVLAKISLISQMYYRTSFFLAILTKVLRVAILIYFFQAVYLNVPEIAGWKLYEVVFLFAVFSMVDFLTNALFYRNLSYTLPWYIQSGEWDFRLTKPVNKLFYASCEEIDLMDSISIVPVIFLLIYVIPKLAIDFAFLQILMGVLLIIVAVLFIYAIAVIAATTYFWIISGRGLGMTVANLIGMGRWPTDIYRGYAGIIFNFIFPISIIATIPAKTFLGDINWPIILYATVLTIIFLLIAVKFWHFGLKHYSSASS